MMGEDQMALLCHIVKNWYLPSTLSGTRTEQSHTNGAESRKLSRVNNGF
jgi:hypothetical protein